MNSNNSRNTAFQITVFVINVLTSLLLASVNMPVNIINGQSDVDFEFICGALGSIVAIFLLVISTLVRTHKGMIF